MISLASIASRIPQVTGKKPIRISVSCTEASPMQFFTMNGPGKARDKEMDNCVGNKPCVSYITYRNTHVISTRRKLALKSVKCDLEKVNKAWTFLPLIMKKAQHQIKLSGGRLETKLKKAVQFLRLVCRTHCYRILLSLENSKTKNV